MHKPVPIASLLLCFFTSAVAAPATRPGAGPIPIEEVRSRQILGDLGVPMGTWVTIEGAPIDGKDLLFKDAWGRKYLNVERVDGRRMPKPVQIELRDSAGSLPNGIIARTSGTLNLSGYETAAYDGIVSIPAAEMIPGTARRASLAFHLRNFFIVGEIVQQNGAEAFGQVEASGLNWNHLSSRHGDLPVPGESTEQTGAVVGNLDKSHANGFVLSFRQKAPALVWYRKTNNGWDRYVIDKDYLTVEAGGVMFDVDGDGLPDLVFGADWQGGDVWWWKNPGPPYDPNTPWKRYLIKHGGAHQHHDQVIADFKGTGKPQLVYWNQGAKKLFIADIPAHPTHLSEWPATEVFSGAAGENAGKYAEGVAACDIDGDGKVDLLAGNYWFKYLGNNQFKAVRIGDIGGRIAADRLIKGSKFAQVVIASGDGIGPLKWYECKGDPQKTSDWIGHDLLGRDMIHGHSLQIADIDGDGNLDIFTAEMAKWTEKRRDPDNPNAEAFIFFGDGKGNFRKTVFAKGIGFHEARVADLNGDGLMDILDKPYNWEVPRVDVWLQVRPSK